MQSLAQLGVHVLKADLSELEEIEDVFKQLPSIDVAILNAGVGYFQNAFDLTDDEISSMIDVNVKAPILLANRFAKKMIAQKNGHIIFIGSQAGKVATKKQVFMLLQNMQLQVFPMA